jgi:hypothetical protein
MRTVQRTTYETFLYIAQKYRRYKQKTRETPADRVESVFFIQEKKKMKKGKFEEMSESESEDHENILDD